jgi:hypothetical protein
MGVAPFNKLPQTLKQRDLETLASFAIASRDHFWELKVSRYLQYSKLNRLIRFNLQKFQQILSEITPFLDRLTTEGHLRDYNRNNPQRISYQVHVFITLW